MTVFAVYDDPRSASRGIERLLEMSFSAKRISVVFFDDTGPERAAVAHQTRLPMGAAIGATLGCLVGTAAVLGGFVTPSVGVFGGAIFGVLAGAVAGLVIWKKDVDLPRVGDGAGGVLVAVPAESEQRLRRARRALETSGARILEPGS